MKHRHSYNLAFDDRLSLVGQICECGKFLENKKPSIGAIERSFRLLMASARELNGFGESLEGFKRQLNRSRNLAHSFPEVIWNKKPITGDEVLEVWEYAKRYGQQERTQSQTRTPKSPRPKPEKG